MSIYQTEFLQGKRIEISEMILSSKENRLELTWKINVCDKRSTLLFHNVSCFSINSVSVPFEIEGFEVIDHLQEGWQKDSRYEVHDYEDGKVRFFCERVELFG